MKSSLAYTIVQDSLIAIQYNKNKESSRFRYKLQQQIDILTVFGLICHLPLTSMAKISNGTKEVC